MDYAKVNYFIEPVGEAKLRELVAKMNISPRDLLRKKEAVSDIRDFTEQKFRSILEESLPGFKD